MASPLNPSHRTNSVRPGTSGISELVRFDRYGPKSKDVKATAGPTLPALFCCLCCLLVFRLLAGENSFGPHYPWLESVAAVLSALVMAVMFQNSIRRECRKAAAPALGQPEWIAEKRIVVTKEGAETAKSQLLLIEWCYRRFSSSLSSLFYRRFYRHFHRLSLVFFTAVISLADASMASL